MSTKNGIVSVYSKGTANWVEPNTKVYTARLYDEFHDGLLFNFAYLSEDILKRDCHWFTYRYKEQKAKIESMPFSEYLDKHLKEVKGMNPFWDISRAEFLHEYRKKTQ